MRPPRFNNGQPYHGRKVERGKLTGTTDTDYFYFFCPECPDRQILRLLDYGLHGEQEPGGTSYPDERPKSARDFTIVFKLFCPRCKLKDFVKVGNTGWQGGQLPARYAARMRQQCE
jgi:hypothetical protein